MKSARKPVLVRVVGRARRGRSTSIAQLIAFRNLSMTFDGGPTFDQVLVEIYFSNTFSI
jgi:hypothetical protein